MTLTLPFRPLRSALDRYRLKLPPDSEEPAYLRHIHRHLGLTAVEFDAKVDQEVDELLQEIEANRRQALLEALPFERPLSKEECLRMIDTSTPFTSGSTLGMYEWAADLRRSWSNFDMELTRENIDLLAD